MYGLNVLSSYIYQYTFLLSKNNRKTDTRVWEMIT